IGSQIDLAHAKLETLRARAEAASARAALAAIVALLSEKSAIDRKVDELRESSHTTYQQLRAELESRVAQLEASVQAIESKVKAAWAETERTRHEFRDIARDPVRGGHGRGQRARLGDLGGHHHDAAGARRGDL